MKFELTKVWGFDHALRGMRNPKNSWDRSDSTYDIYDVTRGDVTIKELKEYDPNAYVDFVYAPDGAEEIYRAFIMGENDKKLVQGLIRGGSEHRKFMRQIFISLDITAPLYWWKEYDTYKVGTTANSTSTMHKIHASDITIANFETDDYEPSLNVKYDYYNNEYDCMDSIEMDLNEEVNEFISVLEGLRKSYLEYTKKSKDKEHYTEEERKEFKRIAKKYWKELIRWTPESWLQTRTVTLTYENIYAMTHQREFHRLNEWSGIDDEELENFIKWVKSLPYANQTIFLDKAENINE